MAITTTKTITKRDPNLFKKNSPVGFIQKVKDVYDSLGSDMQDLFFLPNSIPIAAKVMKPYIDLYLIDILNSELFRDAVENMIVNDIPSRVSTVPLADYIDGDSDDPPQLTLPVAVLKVYYYEETITIDNPDKDTNRNVGGDSIRIPADIGGFYVIRTSINGVRIFHDTGETFDLIESHLNPQKVNEIKDDIDSDTESPFDNNAFIVMSMSASFSNVPPGHKTGDDSPDPIIIKNIMGMSLGINHKSV